jgi:hypothetical protein
LFDTIDDFILELTLLKEKHIFNSQIKIIYKRLDKVSLRIIIINSLFIDIYYNQDNKRFDFSLINQGNRIFGYDNLQNWHFHPFNEPNKHISCEEPTLEQIFIETIAIVKSLEDNTGNEFKVNN